MHEPEDGTAFISRGYRKLTVNLAAFTPDPDNELTRVYSATGALRAGFSYYRTLDQDAAQNRIYARQSSLCGFGGYS